MLGSILGDGSLRFASDHNVHFRVGHGIEQQAYCEWKHEMLAPFANKMAPTGNGIGFDTIPMNQLAWLHEAVYAHDGSRVATDELVDQLDERAIAAWYCDDGNLSGHYARWGSGTRLKSRTRLKAVPMKVLRKYRKPPTPRKRDRFDIQIEGNHTYLVDHVVVHNSPETQPGGRALKFYSSQRIDIRRIETLKEGTEAVGNR